MAKALWLAVEGDRVVGEEEGKGALLKTIRELYEGEHKKANKLAVYRAFPYKVALQTSLAFAKVEDPEEEEEEEAE